MQIDQNTAFRVNPDNLGTKSHITIINFQNCITPFPASSGTYINCKIQFVWIQKYVNSWLYDQSLLPDIVYQGFKILREICQIDVFRPFQQDCTDISQMGDYMRGLQGGETSTRYCTYRCKSTKMQHFEWIQTTSSQNHTLPSLTFKIVSHFFAHHRIHTSIVRYNLFGYKSM